MPNKFRLSDEQLTDLANYDDSVGDRTRFVARGAVHELRERRRASLSSAEVEELIAIRDAIAAEGVGLVFFHRRRVRAAEYRTVLLKEPILVAQIEKTIHAIETRRAAKLRTKRRPRSVSLLGQPRFRRLSIVAARIRARRTSSRRCFHWAPRRARIR